jgi:adenosyl cobinamide kinase/adenosyl cobinamide phosphate guanylyltransferase/NaMN:DMB phosphoribosyltransferase
MSSQSGRRFLVLGGTRSGKSKLAEQLVSGAASVRYVATATTDPDDPAWTARLAAHRVRRPSGWATEEIGATPDRLIPLLAEAKPDEALLVDDLGGWVTATLDAAGAWEDPARTAHGAAALAAAIRDCPAARLVFVSPEVGLSVVAPTPAGRAFADAIGQVNQAVAEACDGVAFVVAGHPTWIKGAAPRAGAVTAPPAFAPVAGPVLGATPTVTTAQVATSAPAETTVTADQPAIVAGMSLPLPDEDVATAAVNRLANLDVAGAGFGALAPVVAFAAGTQGQEVPRPWQNVRMLLLHADHSGGVAAGDSPAAAAGRLDAAERGEGAWALLAGAAGVAVQTVRSQAAAAPIDEADALAEAEVDAALRYGWQLAESAVDAGTDLIVLGATGAGADATASAVIAAAANGEAAALLGRVVTPDGRIDDLAWMRRCETVRDALHRIHTRARDPRAVLGMLGGADQAVAVGVMLAAVSRRTPVMLDGPVGVAAALIARDFGAQVRHWILLPDLGGHPAVRLGADVLGVTPVLDLKLGLGEGATALAVLPLLRSALTLAATLPTAPGAATLPTASGV